jgi:hypothetical protein
MRLFHEITDALGEPNGESHWRWLAAVCRTSFDAPTAPASSALRYLPCIVRFSDMQRFA